MLSSATVNNNSCFRSRPKQCIYVILFFINIYIYIYINIYIYIYINIHKQLHKYIPRICVDTDLLGKQNRSFFYIPRTSVALWVLAVLVEDLIPNTGQNLFAGTARAAPIAPLPLPQHASDKGPRRAIAGTAEPSPSPVSFFGA